MALRRKRPAASSFQGIVSASPSMLELFDVVRRVARTEAPVLIRGETGTGKELVARAIHELGPRTRKPFRAINAAMLSSELLSSELFGHVRGAFTGAVSDRPGLFSAAHGGTLFLDEIGDLPGDIQARLLRVLEDRTFVPLGSLEPQRADVRFLAATHRSLRREVELGRFRADLMYRVRVVPLFLPPLRERTGDVEVLAWHFVDELNERGQRRIDLIEPRALDAMLAHAWPGNVRELRNAIELAFAIGEGRTLRLKELPPELRGEEPPRDTDAESLRMLERRRIADALRAASGHKAHAAQKLGMSRQTLWRKMREHGLG
ncbi:MAG: sigma 54-interacting transcriptional regulator [Sandaracinaceae bacterium]|nr:sigma 54-interacting transcriptional regulator [Sandaracinaceae bacterium]